MTVPVMTMMPVMMVRTAAEADWLQLDLGDAGGDVQPGLALHADRLQGIGILRTADEEVAAEADADRCVGADTAVTVPVGSAL